MIIRFRSLTAHSLGHLVLGESSGIVDRWNRFSLLDRQKDAVQQILPMTLRLSMRAKRGSVDYRHGEIASSCPTASGPSSR